jgi:hypothetical protein
MPAGPRASAGDADPRRRRRIAPAGRSGLASGTFRPTDNGVTTDSFRARSRRAANRPLRWRGGPTLRAGASRRRVDLYGGDSWGPGSMVGGCLEFARRRAAKSSRRRTVRLRGLGDLHRHGHQRREPGRNRQRHLPRGATTGRPHQRGRQRERSSRRPRSRPAATRSPPTTPAPARRREHREHRQTVNGATTTASCRAQPVDRRRRGDVHGHGDERRPRDLGSVTFREASRPWRRASP